MEQDCRIFIIVEDKWGKEFIKRLLIRLRKYNPKKFKIQSSKGRDKLLSPRLKKALNDAFYNNKYNKAIVFVDLHGEDKEVLLANLKELVGEYINRTTFIIFEHEIEEWIVYSMDLKYSSKPSDALNKYLKMMRGVKKGYKKNKLPGFADRIKIDKLKKQETFKKFLDALDCD
jgi:hypothetical protein